MKASLGYEVLERPRAAYRRNINLYRGYRRKQRGAVRAEIEAGIEDAREFVEYDEFSDRASGAGRETMSPGRRMGYEVKELTDYLPPVYGLLRKAARDGHSWSKLKSELTRTLGKTYAHRHILTAHVMYSVVEDIIGQSAEGAWIDSKNKPVWGSQRFPSFAVVDDKLVLVERRHRKNVKALYNGVHPDTIVDSFVRKPDGSPLTGRTRQTIMNLFHGETVSIEPPKAFITRKRDTKRHLKSRNILSDPYRRAFGLSHFPDLSKLLVGFKEAPSKEKDKENALWARTIGYNLSYTTVVTRLLEQIKRRPGLSVIVHTSPQKWEHVRTSNRHTEARFFVYDDVTRQYREAFDAGVSQTIRVDYPVLTVTVKPSKFKLKDGTRKVLKSAYKRGTL